MYPEERKELKEFENSIKKVYRVAGVCILILFLIKNISYIRNAQPIIFICNFAIYIAIICIIKIMGDKVIYDEKLELISDNFNKFRELMETKLYDWADVCGEINMGNFCKVKMRNKNYTKIFCYMNDVIENGEYAYSKDLEETKEYRDLVRYKILNMASLFVTAVAQYPIYVNKFWEEDDCIETEINAFYMKIILKKFLLLYKAYFDSKKIENISLPELLILEDISNQGTAYKIMYDALKRQLLEKNS